MKILIIGDAKELYVLSFARHLKTADPSLELNVLDTNPRQIKPQAEREGIFSGIFTYETPYTGIAGKLINRCKRFLLEQQLKNKNFDLYIAFGMWVPTCRWLKKITRPEDKILGLLLGTDFFKKDQRPDKVRFNTILHRADLLATSNPEIIRRLKEDNFNPDNLRRVELGLAPMEALENLNNIPVEEAKRRNAIDPDTLVICCGYNASINQQHLEMIRAVQKSAKLPVDHLLIVPLTYGGSAEYKVEVEKMLNQSGLRFRILEEFLERDSIATLWKSVDIFIQVQQTDCLSGSMMENLYCGNIVITGSWLPYQVLKDRGALFFEVDRIEGLGKMLDELIPKKESLREQLKLNATKFEDSFWRNAINKWINILNEFQEPVDEGRGSRR